MKAITIYKLIKKLTKFDSNCKVTIKDNKLYITTVDDEDIEEYENYINSVENQDKDKGSFSLL